MQQHNVLSAPSVRALWSARGVWLGPTTWLIALIGTLVLKDEPGRTIGSLLILFAGVLAVLAWGHLSLSPATDFASLIFLQTRTQWGRAHLLSLAGIVMSAVLSCLANIWFLSHQNEIFGLAG